MAALRDAHIRAATLNSTTASAEKQSIKEDLKCGHPHLRLLYVSPEYCALDWFRRLLRIIYEQRELSRIAIDEAHCISEWGHDFRPQFKELRWFRTEFPDVPIICLTATATERVGRDIISTLGLNPHNLKRFAMTTSRPNLHYEVRFKSDDRDQYDNFIKWLRGVHARRRTGDRAAELTASNTRLDNVSGIIYVPFRRDCEDLAARLISDGIGAKPFHAGLTSEQKDDHLQGWVDNRVGYDVVVATTAFGMGIDKDNVRFVIHWSIPKSFEGYYQEAGRAGRDGKASLCIMYYGREDRDRVGSMMARDIERQSRGRRNSEESVSQSAANPQKTGRAKSFQSLVSYCESTNVCRHKAICAYFGESTIPVCDYACDWHKDAVALVKRKDANLASEEWCSTQRQNGAYVADEYD